MIEGCYSDRPLDMKLNFVRFLFFVFFLDIVCDLGIVIDEKSKCNLVGRDGLIMKF